MGSHRVGHDCSNIAATVLQNKEFCAPEWTPHSPPPKSHDEWAGAGAHRSDLYFRFQFRTHFSEKRGNFPPSTFCLRKTITTKFEFRREGAWVTMANSLRAFTT